VFSVIHPIIRIWISRKYFVHYLGDKASSIHFTGLVASKPGLCGKEKNLYPNQELNLG
jgi:hypothetical protein